MLKLSVSHLWRTGPDWLCLDTLISSDIESLPEFRASNKLSHNCLAIKRKPNIGDVMSHVDFSFLQRLLRVTAYVQRAFFKAKKKSDLNLPITLTPQEHAIAEKLWITNSRKELFLHNDFDTLKHQCGLFRRDCGCVEDSYIIMLMCLFWLNIQFCRPGSTPSPH